MLHPACLSFPRPFQHLHLPAADGLRQDLDPCASLHGEGCPIVRAGFKKILFLVRHRRLDLVAVVPVAGQPYLPSHRRRQNRRVPLVENPARLRLRLQPPRLPDGEENDETAGDDQGVKELSHPGPPFFQLGFRLYCWAMHAGVQGD